jgi:PAS domain-containing protein
MRDRTERRRAGEARKEGGRLLADMAAGLLAAADPDEVLRPVFRALSEEFGIDLSFSYVPDGEERGSLRLSSCFGVPEGERAAYGLVRAWDSICGAAAAERRVVHVPDARESGDDPRCGHLRRLGVRAFVAFPLLAGGGGRLLGVLSFGSRSTSPFSGEDLAFLGAIAHHVAVVRERLRAEAALRGSEVRFRALARASSEVLYRMSPDWSEMRQLSGGGFLADAAAPTKGWLDDYIHPDDRPAVRAAIDDAIRRKGVFELEHRVRRPDGGLGWTHSGRCRSWAPTARSPSGSARPAT